MSSNTYARQGASLMTCLLCPCCNQILEDIWHGEDLAVDFLVLIVFCYRHNITSVVILLNELIHMLTPRFINRNSFQIMQNPNMQLVSTSEFINKKGYNHFKGYNFRHHCECCIYAPNCGQSSAFIGEGVASLSVPSPFTYIHAPQMNIQPHIFLPQFSLSYSSP